jgi:hypothetical protein
MKQILKLMDNLEDNKAYYKIKLICIDRSLIGRKYSCKGHRWWSLVRWLPFVQYLCWRRGCQGRTWVAWDWLISMRRRTHCYLDFWVLSVILDDKGNTFCVNEDLSFPLLFLALSKDNLDSLEVPIVFHQ